MKTYTIKYKLNGANHIEIFTDKKKFEKEYNRLNKLENVKNLKKETGIG